MIEFVIQNPLLGCLALLIAVSATLASKVALGPHKPAPSANRLPSMYALFSFSRLDRLDVEELGQLREVIADLGERESIPPEIVKHDLQRIDFQRGLHIAQQMKALPVQSR